MIKHIIKLLYHFFGISIFFFILALLFFWSGMITVLVFQEFSSELIIGILLTAAGVFFAVRRHRKIKDGLIANPFEFIYTKPNFNFRKKTNEKPAEQKSVTELFEDFLKRKFYAKYYFSLTPSEKSPDVYSTKLGGIPYMPKGTEYPCDGSGNPLRLLAQLNFDELPHLQYYPSGILQFFCKDNFKYGMNPKNLTEQEEFRIVYHDTVTDRENLLSESEMPQFTEQPFTAFPIIKETALAPSEVRTDTPRLGDYRFEELLLEFAKLYKLCPKRTKSLIDLPTQYKDPIYKAFSESSTAVGGFVPLKKDPRNDNSELRKFDNVLLRLDGSTTKDYINGFESCCFLISTEDLKNKDFSKVMYYWEK